jgi:signal transduction histidine kinase
MGAAVRRAQTDRQHSEENRRIEQGLQWRSEVERAVADLSAALLESVPVDEISYRVLDHARRLTGSAFGYVGYIDAEGRLVCPTMTRDIWDVCQVPDKDIIFDAFGGLWGWVLDHHESLMTNAPLEDPRSSGAPEGHLPIRRFLSAPALIGGELVGQIALANPTREYTDADLELVERLASLYALAIQRRKMESKMADALAALGESEQRFRSLFEAMTEGFALHEIVDGPSGAPIDYVIVDANPAYERHTGLVVDAVIGRRASEVYETGEPPYLETYAAVAETGEPVEFEVYHAPLDRYFRISAFSPADSQFATVFEDITERRLAEQALAEQKEALARSNAELESFAYIASHDLREPLRKVQAFGDRLQSRYEEALDDRGVDYLRRMQDAAHRMEALIDDLLTYSRVTTKAEPFETIDLNTVVEEAVADLEMRIEETAGRVEVGSLPVVDADRVQVRRLMQNLIGNALKFHKPETSPVVNVTGNVIDNGEGVPGRMAVITVRDNGIGFDLKYKDRIFKPFQRLHGRSTYEGTGMGLAICRKIAARHGGDVEVESEPGQGSCFTVTLPLEQEGG